MASKSKAFGNSQFMANHLDIRAEHQERFEKELEAARQPAMAEALELFSFMSALPAALLDSQKREAKRLRRAGRDKDPRLDALNAAMEETNKLRTTALRGQARVDRALASLSVQGDVFHGFVSDTDLRPLKGYSVKLTSSGEIGGKKELSGSTEEDGYFCMDIGDPQASKRSFGKRDDGAKLMERVTGLFGSTGLGTAARAESSAAASTDGPQVQVEVFDGHGTSVHQDPFPFSVDGGSVYREYVVKGEDGRPSQQRYAGNASKLELHDTQNLSKRCNFDRIKPGGLVYFADTASAEKLGYDYCAYCFGKAKSAR